MFKLGQNLPSFPYEILHSYDQWLYIINSREIMSFVLKNNQMLGYRESSPIYLLC